MSRRLLLAILCVSALALRAAEIPLGASTPGPGDSLGTIGAVPSGDGFLLVRWAGASGYTKSHIYASRLSSDGKHLDAQPLLIASMDGYWYRTFTLTLEDNRPVLTAKTVIPEKPGDWTRIDYEVKRMTLDSSDGHVVDMTTNVYPDDFDIPGPKNSRGETLKITYGTGRPTVWFVGADGVPRKPTPLDNEARSVVSVVPYGDDEWLILCNAYRGLVWYRMSEATRGTPRKQLFDIVYPTYPDNWQWEQHIATADGDFAVLTEEDSTRYTSQRDLTLRIIKADGYSARYPLIEKEILGVGSPSPLRPATASLAKEGNAWLVAYSYFDASGHQELRVWRVDGKATLTKVETFSHHGDHGAILPMLVAGATRNLLLFHRQRDYSNDHAHDLYSHTWDRGATIPSTQTAELLTAGLPPQRTPSAIAAPGGGVSAVWREGDTRGDVMLRVGEQVTRISSQSWDSRSPSIARNGDTIAVAWLEVHYGLWLDPERQRVVVRRFDAQGGAIDAAPVVIADSVTMPARLRVSIGAEGDGFRVAWNGRSQQKLSAGARAAPTVYTTHLAARGESIATPEEITPPYLAAGEPAVIAHGAETLLLWAQSDGVYAKRYVDGKEARSSTQKLMSGGVYAAAIHDGELLLATARWETNVCTEAQRFSTSGAALSPAVTIACTERPGLTMEVSVAWDAGRWWVAPANFRLTDVYALDANGTPVDTARFFAPDVSPQSLSLVATGSGPSVVYVRSDAAASMVDRAFLHTFPRAKARSVRP